MADAFTDEQIQEFYEAFCLIDKDSDGFITKEKLTKVMKSMGKNPKAEQLREMMSDVDIFGNGGITFDDFLYIMAQNTSQESSSDELIEVFRVFDRDGDGLISPLELEEGMKDMGMKITAEEAEHMVREADLDGNGLLRSSSDSSMRFIYHLLFQASLYLLWRERNSRIHSDISRPPSQLLKEITSITKTKLLAIMHSSHPRDLSLLHV